MLTQDRGLVNFFKLVPRTLVAYVMQIEDHYLRENPYHNSIHAADVAQSSHVLLSIPFFEVRPRVFYTVIGPIRAVLYLFFFSN